MLSLEYIRRHPDEVRRAAALKGEEAPVDEVLDLDRRWREATGRAEAVRAEQNARSKEFGPCCRGCASWRSPRRR